MFQEIPLVPGRGKRKKPIYGVGINDADYKTAYKLVDGKQISCPFYSTWCGVLERCLCPKFKIKNPTYIGCTIDESWKTFSVFKAWMMQQDWQGKHLDKDLLIQGNKHYGPTTCLFITPGLNNLLVSRINHRGPYPIGVTLFKTGKYTYYKAMCSFYGKQTQLGYFKTPQEAHSVYVQAKLSYIAELASKESDIRISNALLNLTIK